VPASFFIPENSKGASLLLHHSMAHLSYLGGYAKKKSYTLKPSPLSRHHPLK
jgi:hypothetical protein